MKRGAFQSRRVGPRRRLAFIVTAGVCLASLGACGRPDNQRDLAVPVAAAPQADRGAGNSSPPGDSVAPPGTDATPGTGATNGSQPAAGGIEQGYFGTLDPVCGPAPEGEENVDTESQGVSADEVVVGTFSDPENQARPGLNQELFDVADVFAAWCNELGGIHGRQIKVNKHDAGLGNVAAEMIEACGTDFFSVGGGNVFDSAGVEPRLDCLLPQIPGFVVEPAAITADLQVLPYLARVDLQSTGAFRYVDDQYPDTTTKVGLLTGNLPALQSQARNNQEAIAEFGWKSTYYAEYNPIGESSWQPYAERIKSEGVEGLIYIGEPANLGLLMEALANVGHTLTWVYASPNIYDQGFIDAAGGTLADTEVFMSLGSAVFEQADSVPAIADHLALFEQYKPKGKARTLLALQSINAWLFFAHAAKACGAELTRRCVYDNALAIEKWDAGGLYATFNPKDASSNGCSLIVKATPDGFVPADWKLNGKANEAIFNCDRANYMKLKGPFDPGLTLEDVGKSLDDLE